jgi:hypothetical protein
MQAGRLTGLFCGHGFRATETGGGHQNKEQGMIPRLLASPGVVYFEYPNKPSSVL